MTTNTPTSLAQEIELRIHEALGSCGYHDDARHISVRMANDCAVLNGTVLSWPERKTAEAAALGTPGVGRVDNHLALLVKGHVCR